MRISFKYIFLLVVLFWGANTINAYIDGSFSKGKEITRDTRNIYSVIHSKIIELNGDSKQIGGKIYSSFRILADFSFSASYNYEQFISSLEDMGFVLNTVQSTNHSYVLCRNNSGFLITGSITLDIDYRYTMPYCTTGE